MINTKGEISTMVILGTLIVMGFAAVLSSTINNQRQVTDTRAAGITCSNNPVAPPDGGYTWVANCAKSCNTNADCPQNTTDPSNVNPATSNWCYGFAEGAKCLQLQKGSITSQPSNTNPTNSPTNPSGTQGGVCSVATGCGGACNSNFNQGCGYGGCREWEDCVNNTCIDTTNLGTQSAGENACHSLATVGSPENTSSSGQPSNTPTTVPPTNIPQNPTSQTQPTQIVPTNQQPSPTPTPNRSCSQGYKWCSAVNECRLEYEPCPEGTNTPTPRTCEQGYKWCSSIRECSLEYNPCPSPTQSLSDQTRGNTSIFNPQESSNKKVKVTSDTTAKACTGTPSIDDGCIDVFGEYSQ
jgi:hypothetical protein